MKSINRCKYFNPIERQRIVEETLAKYYSSIEDKKIRETLDKMPKTQETLDIIEQELANIVADIKGNNPTEKFKNALIGVRAARKMVGDKLKPTIDDKTEGSI